MTIAGDEALAAITGRLESWLWDKALPLWWEQGADHARGGFIDTLGQDGKPADRRRRARVQARQSWTYAFAGELGWPHPWQAAADHGLAFLWRNHLRPDGQFSTMVSEDGAILDATATLYDHTFALLALAELQKLFPARAELTRQGLELLNTQMAIRRHPQGGFVESAPEAFQSNPHMHLLEAALAWCETGHDPLWDRLADDIAELCLSRLINSHTGAIAEYFDPSWRPLPDVGEQHVEPGHQFEWAWLLERWGLLRDHPGAKRAARKLFELGSLGVDSKRGVAVDEMTQDFAIRRATARLWPQAERAKAASLLMQSAAGAERARFRDAACEAARALWRYLETPLPGLWRDRMRPDGNFIEEPAPASSFYHIICCISVLRQGCGHD